MDVEPRLSHDSHFEYERIVDCQLRTTLSKSTSISIYVKQRRIQVNQEEIFWSQSKVKIGPNGPLNVKVIYPFQ